MKASEWGMLTVGAIFLGTLGFVAQKQFSMNERLAKAEGRLEVILQLQKNVESLNQKITAVRQEVNDLRPSEAYDCLTTVTAPRPLVPNNSGESCWLKLEHGRPVQITCVFA